MSFASVLGKLTKALLDKAVLKPRTALPSPLRTRREGFLWVDVCPTVLVHDNLDATGDYLRIAGWDTVRARERVGIVARRGWSGSRYSWS